MKALKKFWQVSECVIAFMPIKPVYVQRILDGEKNFEFRRTRIRSDLTHIVIYSCYPVKKVVGIAKVKSVNEASPSRMWDLTKHAAGISRKDFRSYFTGAKLAFAISLGEVLTLNSEICPTQISKGFTIPQSYRYIDASFVQKITTLGLD